MSRVRIIGASVFIFVVPSLAGCEHVTYSHEWRAIRNTPSPTDPEVSVFGVWSARGDQYLSINTVVIKYPGMKPTLIQLVPENLERTTIHMLDGNGKAHQIPVRLDKIGSKYPTELQPFADPPIPDSNQK